MTSEFSSSTERTSVKPTPAPQGHGNLSRKALGGLLLALAVTAAGCGGSDNDSPPAAEQPPAGQPPAGQPPAGEPPAGQPPAGETPAPSPATTVPANMASGTPLADGAPVYYADANTNGTHDAGERTVIYNPTTKTYYELVVNRATPGGAEVPVGWNAALAAAQQRGGHLFIGETNAEIQFVRQAYTYAKGGTPPVYGGLPADEEAGALGAWIGLAAAQGAQPNNWSWIKADSSLGGGALEAGAPWLVHATFARPNGDATTGELRAAMVGGNNLPADNTPTVAPDPSPEQCLYELQSNQTIARYIVEYDTAAAVTAVPQP